MENKKTSELIDLLGKLKDEDYEQGGKYEQITTELESREQFYSLLSEDHDESIPALWEIIKELKDDIKKLKRHKHHEKTDDVLIRI